MNNFTTKNTNRKAHRDHSQKGGTERREALDARNGRRLRGGAFGTEDAKVFNRLAVGTTGTPRQEKSGEAA
jgi:hypothetical protein